MSRDELIAALQELPENIQILVARDEEWNSLNELYALTRTIAATDMFEWQAVHPNDVGEYEDEELQDAVVLWG